MLNFFGRRCGRRISVVLRERLRLLVLTGFITMSSSLSTTVVADTLLVPQEYATIEAAMDAAVDGDVIEVAPGLYIETFSFNGKTVTLCSAEGPEVTILEPDPATPSDQIVFLNSGENAASEIRGFTLRNGGSSNGAISVVDSGPTIRGNIFQNNCAFLGGAITVVMNLPVEGPKIIGNRFDGNEADRGGAVYVIGAGTDTLIEDNVFVNNLAFGSPPFNCGGGISCTTSGGGSALIRNNLFRGNTAMGVAACGGAAYLDGPSGSVFFENNTVVENTAEYGGGVASLSNVPIKNCILWGNFASVDNPQLYPNMAGQLANYCCVEGGAFGVGVIDLDPQFVTGPLGDHYLSPTSPCVDAGDPNSPFLDGTTQADQSLDFPPTDMGYHYPIVDDFFIRGDCNADGNFDIADPVATLTALFVTGAPPPPCGVACDANSDAALDVSDAVFSLTTQFLLGPVPGDPYPDCGLASLGVLGCDAFDACP